MWLHMPSQPSCFPWLSAQIFSANRKLPTFLSLPALAPPPTAWERQGLYPGLFLCAPCTVLDPVGLFESGHHRPDSCSTRMYCLGPCQDLSLEFALENFWSLLTNEDQVMTASVPEIRVSVHAARKRLQAPDFSLAVCYSFLFSSP